MNPNPSPTTSSETQVYSKTNLPPVPGYRYYDTPEIPHVHAFDGKTLMGGSSVVSILETPLAWWASGMAVGNMGWIFNKKKVGSKYVFHSEEERMLAAQEVLNRIKKMDAKEYVALLDESYRAHNDVKDKAADSGTVRHSFLEEYIKPCIATMGGVPQVYTGTNADVGVFADWSIKNIKRFLWSEINSYHLDLWVGGIADVGWEDMEGKIIAGDFKSSKEAYFKHYIQICLYDIMLSTNGGYTAEGVKVFDMPGIVDGYCVIPFGQLTNPYGDKKLAPEFVYNAQEFRDVVLKGGIVGLYKLKREYDSKS